MLPVVLVLVGLASSSLAQSDLTISPDGSQTLVQKDLGGQRWAIVRDRATGRVTGNVFDLSGGPAQFIACTAAGAQGADLLLDCSGTTGSCQTEPCPWSSLGRLVLPASFFELRVGPPPSAGSCSTFVESCADTGDLDFDAAGGQVYLDDRGSVDTRDSSLSVTADLSFPSALIIVQNLPAFVSLTLSASGPDEFSTDGSGRLVLQSFDRPGGAGLCPGPTSVPAVGIRVIRQRVEFCKVCSVGQPVTARFELVQQVQDGTECRVSGEFKMFRTR